MLFSSAAQANSFPTLSRQDRVVRSGSVCQFLELTIISHLRMQSLINDQPESRRAWPEELRPGELGLENSVRRVRVEDLVRRVGERGTESRRARAGVSESSGRRAQSGEPESSSCRARPESSNRRAQPEESESSSRRAQAGELRPESSA